MDSKDLDLTRTKRISIYFNFRIPFAG